MQTGGQAGNDQRADQGTRDRAHAAQGRCASQDTGSNGIQLIAGAGSNRTITDIGCQHDASHAAQEAHQDEHPEYYAVDVDTGKARGFPVATDGIGVPAEAGVV